MTETYYTPSTSGTGLDVLNNDSIVFAYTASGDFDTALVYKGILKDWSNLATDKLLFGKKSATGIAQPDARVNGISVYPNPAMDKIMVNIETADARPLEITLTDIAGKMVKQVKCDQLSAGKNSIEIPVNMLSAGIYFVNIGAQSIKVIKQ